MVLPDLEVIVAKYVADPSADAGNQFMADSILGKVSRSRGLKGFLRDWLGNRQHLWMWDFKGLAAELAAAGFRNIRRAEYGDSSQAAYELVEVPERWKGCLGIECTK
jgi:hypothetical protein